MKGWIGHWAVSLGREVFKIEEAYTAQGEPHFIGTGLHGQRVHTSCPSMLPIEDHNVMEENHHANEEAVELFFTDIRFM